MRMNAARKVKLGQRWICYACSTRFYDLKRPQPICPRCQADQRESPVFAKPKAKRKRAKKAAAEPAPTVLEPVDSETLAAADDIEDLDADLDADVDEALDSD